MWFNILIKDLEEKMDGVEKRCNLLLKERGTKFAAVNHVLKSARILVNSVLFVFNTLNQNKSAYLLVERERTVSRSKPQTELTFCVLIQKVICIHGLKL